MRRREFLGAAGAAAAGGLAGCADLFETRSALSPPLVEDRPDAVYYPTHVEGMKMAGMATDGAYECALTYTYPHRFWRVTGDRATKVDIETEDAVHLMPVVWNAETGVVPPDANPTLTVTRDGETVTQTRPWAMLSQPMGFHFGDNVELDGDGTYRVEVTTSAPSTRRTGALADDRSEASFAFRFDYQQSTVDEISFRDIPAEKQGTEGAVPPMEMKTLPTTRAPAVDALPGTVRGTGTSGDIEFAVTTLQDPPRFEGVGDGTYLAVSPRTPYNRYVLPLMSLSGTLRRGGETVYDGILRPTLDPELRYHYGAVVRGIESGDELTVSVDSPPQVARHEGYETAFFEAAETRLTL